MSDIQYTFQSSVGPIYIVVSEKGLRGLYVKPRRPTSTSQATPSSPLLKKVISQLTEYFEGRRQEFDLPLDVDGTEFQKKVWTELSKIPYGKTVCYSDIANRLKNPKAVRAVGTANGRNPISIIVPCHRVIARDGTLGGYAGGLDMKTRLLEIEGVTTKKSRLKPKE